MKLRLHIDVVLFYRPDHTENKNIYSSVTLRSTTQHDICRQRHLNRLNFLCLFLVPVAKLIYFFSLALIFVCACASAKERPQNSISCKNIKFHLSQSFDVQELRKFRFEIYLKLHEFQYDPIPILIRFVCNIM